MNYRDVGFILLFLFTQQQMSLQQRGKFALPNSGSIDDKPGVRCDFETECAWTWNTSMADSFKVVTVATLNAKNRTERLLGPQTDLKGKYM